MLHRHRLADTTHDCPMTCLGLSAHAYNRLKYNAYRFGPPTTVGHVLTLAESGQLKDIAGLGPVRIAEIESKLRMAGFTSTDPQVANTTRDSRVST